MAARGSPAGGGDRRHDGLPGRFQQGHPGDASDQDVHPQLQGAPDDASTRSPGAHYRGGLCQAAGANVPGDNGTLEVLFRPAGSRRWRVKATIFVYAGSYLYLPRAPFQAWIRLRQSGSIQARFIQT
jgi:hypothetical protein